MIYRRVTEITEIDQPSMPGLPKYWSQQPSFGRTGFSNQPPKLGPFLKRKRIMDSWEELSLSEEVRSFKRVRILSKFEKARKTAFDSWASWEDKVPWVATETKQDVPTALRTHLESFAARAADNDAACQIFPRRETVISRSSSLDEADLNLVAPTGNRAYFPQRGYSPLAWYVDPPARGRRIVSLQIVDERSDVVQIDEPVSPRDEGWLFEDRGYVDRHASSKMRPENMVLNIASASSINARRARLLQLLPGGPILAPISEPECHILDIGSTSMWSSIGKLTCRIDLSIKIPR